MTRLPMYETEEAAREGVGLQREPRPGLSAVLQLRRAPVPAPSGADVERARVRLRELAAEIAERHPS